MSRLGMISCCWQWDKRKQTWVWKHTFRIDEDGHPMEGAPAWAADRPAPWGPWLNGAKPDEDGYVNDYNPRRGRAVTGWTFLNGVVLLGINLPEKPSAGFEDFLESKLEQVPQWSQLVREGHRLRLGTAEEAQALITPDDPKEN